MAGRTDTLPKQTEAEFTTAVIQLARLRGWRVLHLRPARTGKGWRTAVQGDGVGFPDLLLVRKGVLVVAELKVGKNTTTGAQAAWLDDFRRAGVPTHVWRPEDWAAIEATLED